MKTQRNLLEETRRNLLKERRRDLLQAGILILLALFLHSGGLALQTQARLADKIVRLHIVANSDDPADQARKLRVRDAVLARAESLLDGAQNREEAAARLRQSLPELEAAAETALAENGWHGPVSARVRESTFPTKEYGGFSLPAGRYLALQIVIGAGAGQNWWCVVFPPLCTGAAVTSGNATGGHFMSGSLAAETVFSAGEIRLITEESQGYVLKFKAVEWWEKAREACAEFFTSEKNT